MLDSRVSIKVRSGESCPSPPPLPLGLFSKPCCPGLSPARAEGRPSANGREEPLGTAASLTQNRLCLPPGVSVRDGGTGGLANAPCPGKGAHRAHIEWAGTYVKPGWCPHIAGKGWGTSQDHGGWGSRLQASSSPPSLPAPSWGCKGADGPSILPFLPVPNLLQAGEWYDSDILTFHRVWGIPGVALLPICPGHKL